MSTLLNGIIHYWAIPSGVVLLFSLWFHHKYLTHIKEWSIGDWLFLLITSIFYPIGIILMLCIAIHNDLIGSTRV